MRKFERNVPDRHEFVQGRNADRNARLSQTLQALGAIQPGNIFGRQIRPYGDLVRFPRPPEGK